jgi:hypothetical protein
LLTLFFLVAGVLLVSGCGEQVREAGEQAAEQATGVAAVELKLDADKNLAIARAKALYAQKFVEGMNMEKG